MTSKMIPSAEGNGGLVTVFQVEKYSPYWMAKDGRIFEMFSPGSFTQVSQPFDGFQGSGEPRDGQHSGFGEVRHEKESALNAFNAQPTL